MKNELKSNSFFISLRLKLILLFITLIAVPFIISGFFTYNKYKTDVEENARKSTHQLVRQININLDNYLREVDKLTLMPFYDNSVLEILKTHSGEPNGNIYIPSTEYDKMSFFISSLSYGRTDIRGIFIIANDGTMFNDLDIKNYKKSDTSSYWLEKITRKNFRILLIPPHHTGYYADAKERVFSVIREIKDPYSEQSLGVIKIDLTNKSFSRVLDDTMVSSSSRIYITDWSNNIYYPANQQDNNLNLPSGGTVSIEGTEYISAFHSSSITGLNIVGMVSENQMEKDAVSLMRFTFIISLVSLVLAIIIAIVISSKITKPVRHLQKKMKKVQKGNFDERVEVFYRDEIGDLSQGFNVMMDEINKLIKEVYETKLRERDAELSALQSQINPHFLYNTFELVNMMAIENDQFEISDIISSLGSLLRYTVNKKEKPVLLREEVRFIKAYRKILSSRYGEKLKIELLIDPYLEYCLVPKLILQPLVENAVQHGVQESEGIIKVKAIRGDECLILIVEDNGIGISQEKYEILREKIYGEEVHNEEVEAFGRENKGYALRNVHQRLKILYGNEFGMEIDRCNGEGCKFILRLPLIFYNSRKGDNDF